jgi:hypothetical protein
MVCIIRNYSQISYRYFELVASQYGEMLTDEERLSRPGYGLAAVFTPEKTPFKIQKINMAAVANHTGTAEEYDRYHFIVRILDAKKQVVWSKSLPWSYYKSPGDSAVPRLSGRALLLMMSLAAVILPLKYSRRAMSTRRAGTSLIIIWRWLMNELPTAMPQPGHSYLTTESQQTAG